MCDSSFNDSIQIAVCYVLCIFVTNCRIYSSAHTHTHFTHTHVVYKFVYFKPGKSKESCKEEEDTNKLVENIYGGWFISFYNLQGYITCQYAYKPITMHVPQ